MNDVCRIAVVQMKSDTDKHKNLAQSMDYIRESRSKKAQIICFPEFQMGFSPSIQSPKELSDIAESAHTGRFVTSLARCAKENGIEIVASIYEKARSKENKVFDSALAINKRGLVISLYRKIHLYDAMGFRESDKFLAGNTIEKPTRFLCAKVGLMICYDVRFPEMSRILSVEGADFLIAPSAWAHGIMKEEHWQTFLKARAIENGIYMIAPDQIGNLYSGRSMIVDPFGTVLLDMGNKEGMEVVEIDKSVIKKVRDSLPLLRNRRTDVYKKDLFAFRGY
jgi:predicted amidohydrolase